MGRDLDNLFGEIGKFWDPIAIGFDDLFNQVGHIYEYSIGGGMKYPPYDVIRSGDSTTIEVALAGLVRDDIKIYVEKNTLNIEYRKPEETGETEASYVHRGVARRSFHLTFRIMEGIVVNGATFDNGMLRVMLQKVTPEAEARTEIKIS